MPSASRCEASRSASRRERNPDPVSNYRAALWTGLSVIGLLAACVLSWVEVWLGMA